MDKGKKNNNRNNKKKNVEIKAEKVFVEDSKAGNSRAGGVNLTQKELKQLANLINKQSENKRSQPRKQRGNNTNGTGGGAGDDMLAEATAPKQLSARSVECIKYNTTPFSPTVAGDGAAKIPDGAAKQSAGAPARTVVTLNTPFQVKGQVDLLGGETYSVIIYTPPTLRGHSIIIVNSADGELTSEEKREVYRTFATIPNRAVATYPEWVSVTDTIWWTVTPLRPLLNIPDALVQGSTLVDEYRTTQKSVLAFFNTPSLVDQGTCVLHRTNTNYTKVVLEVTRSHPNSVPFNFMFSVVRTGNTANVPLASTNLGNKHQMVPASNIQLGAPVANFVANHKIVKAQSPFKIDVGDLYTYTFTGTDANARLAIRNVTDDIELELWSGAIPIGSNYFRSVVLEELPGGDDVAETVIETEVNLLILPPFEQGDIYQQNPGAGIDLAKNGGRVEVVNNLFDPVYLMHPGSDYHKVVIVGREVDITPDMVDPLLGWNDIIYPHISSSVINYQSFPYACKIMMEESSGNELVAGQDSVIGWFVTKNRMPETGTVEILKEIAQLQPAGYCGDGDPREYVMAELVGLVGKLGIAERVPSVIGNLATSIMEGIMGAAFPVKRRRNRVQRDFD